MKHLKTFEDNNEYSITKLNSSILIDAVPIINNNNILQKIIDFQTIAFDNNEKSLSETLINELTNAFGKENISKKYEHITKIWILKYKDLIFNVYSAKHKGTSISIREYTYSEIRSGKRMDDIIEFLEELYAIINNISMEELNFRRDTNKYNI